MSEHLELAQTIYKAGVDAEQPRDLIIVEMVKAGISLNTAQNLYKQIQKENGDSNPRSGRKAEALEYLKTSAVGVDLTDIAIRKQLRDTLSEKFEVTASTATDYIKAHATVMGVELPASQFGSSAQDQETIFIWITKNPDCSKEEFSAFMTGDMGRSKGSIDETYRGIVLARKLFAIDGFEFAPEAVLDDGEAA